MAPRPSYYWWFAPILISDQVSKAWMRASFPEQGGLPYPWSGVFELKLTYNTGVAFGFLSGLGVLLMPLAIGFVFWTVWHSAKHPNLGSWLHAALGMLAAGAIGNFIDRLTAGRVTDMFWFRLIDFPVFNVADSAITVGAVILAFHWMAVGSKQEKPSAAQNEGELGSQQ